MCISLVKLKFSFLFFRLFATGFIFRWINIIKDHHVLFVIGPSLVYNKFKMADDRNLKNLKITIYPQWFERLQRNLAGWRLGWLWSLQILENLIFFESTIADGRYFKNLKINIFRNSSCEQSEIKDYRSDASIIFDEIWLADWVWLLYYLAKYRKSQ